MTGIELIAKERQEQIEKHGRTVEKDVQYNEDGQLIDAILLLILSLNSDNHVALKEPPKHWDEPIWHHMLQKTEHDKLILMGAFAAAEIDRLNYKK